jgi:hypothetical protein
MSVLAATTAAILLVSSPGAAGSADASRLAATGGFLLGNAHRCGIATDRVVKAGRLIRALIAAAARDPDEQQKATERFAKFFMATAAPDKADSKLIASCDLVSSEFDKFESHRVADLGAAPAEGKQPATGDTAPPRFRLGDGE